MTDGDRMDGAHRPGPAGWLRSVVVVEDSPGRPVRVVQGQREEPAVHQMAARPLQALRRHGPQEEGEVMGKPYTNQEQYDKDRKAEKRLNSPRVRRQESRLMAPEARRARKAAGGK